MLSLQIGERFYRGRCDYMDLVVVVELFAMYLPGASRRRVACMAACRTPGRPRATIPTYRWPLRCRMFTTFRDRFPGRNTGSTRRFGHRRGHAPCRRREDGSSHLRERRCRLWVTVFAFMASRFCRAHVSPGLGMPGGWHRLLRCRCRDGPTGKQQWRSLARQVDLVFLSWASLTTVCAGGLKRKTVNNCTKRTCEMYSPSNPGMSITTSARGARL